MKQKGVGSRMGWTAHCTRRSELYNIHCWVGICEIIITLINAGLRFSVGHIDFEFSKQAAVGRVCVCVCVFMIVHVHDDIYVPYTRRRKGDESRENVSGQYCEPAAAAVSHVHIILYQYIPILYCC